MNEHMTKTNEEKAANISSELVAAIDRLRKLAAQPAVADWLDAEHSNDPIRVWRFQDAPKDLAALSRDGGDEDWLALVPVYLRNAYISWLEDGGPFGVCSVSRHDLPDGRVVFIGAHA